jgi:hypothetical protein
VSFPFKYFGTSILFTIFVANTKKDKEVMYNKSEAYQGPKYFSYNGKGVFASGSGSSSDDVRNLSL